MAQKQIVRRVRIPAQHRTLLKLVRTKKALQSPGFYAKKKVNKAEDFGVWAQNAYFLRSFPGGKLLGCSRAMWHWAPGDDLTLDWLICLCVTKLTQVSLFDRLFSDPRQSVDNSSHRLRCSLEQTMHECQKNPDFRTSFDSLVWCALLNMSVRRLPHSHLFPHHQSKETVPCILF